MVAVVAFGPFVVVAHSILQAQPEHAQRVDRPELDSEEIAECLEHLGVAYV